MQTRVIEPVYTHCTLLQGISYLLFFWVMVIWIINKHRVPAECKIVGYGDRKWVENKLFLSCTAFKSHSKSFIYWPPSGNQQPLLFLQQKLPEVTQQRTPQEVVVSGCLVAMWHSENLLPVSVSTEHSNWKKPKHTQQPLKACVL